MKTIENVKVKDFVEICDTDRMVKDFIVAGIFSNIDIEHLRYLCAIVENKKYKVFDVCKGCKFVKIKIGKKFVPVKYRYIIKVY